MNFFKRIIDWIKDVRRYQSEVIEIENERDDFKTKYKAYKKAYEEIGNHVVKEEDYNKLKAALNKVSHENMLLQNENTELKFKIDSLEVYRNEYNKLIRDFCALEASNTLWKYRAENARKLLIDKENFYFYETEKDYSTLIK